VEVWLYPFLTSALDGGGWSTSHSGCYAPGKETHSPLYRRLGESQYRLGEEKIIVSTGVRTPEPSSPGGSCGPRLITYLFLKHIFLIFAPSVVLPIMQKKIGM
jgi:hypothetical protein